MTVRSVELYHTTLKEKKRISIQTYLALEKAQGYTTFDLGNGHTVKHGTDKKTLKRVHPNKITFFYSHSVKKREWFFLKLVFAFKKVFLVFQGGVSKGV